MTTPNDRVLTIPVAALHALRYAALDAPHGDERLHEAGQFAGLALYDDFAAHVRDAHGVEPDTLPLAQFVTELTAHLADRGWGVVQIEAGDDALSLSSTDWIEGEPDAGATRPQCHFSCGVLAGLFGRVAGATVEVTEVACRSAGAERDTFVVGARAT